jgi:hypothetical protein
MLLGTDKRVGADAGMRPAMPLHQYCLRRLNGMIDMAIRYTQTRHDQYTAIEQLWLNYVDPDELAADGSPKSPNKRAVVIPFTYASCQTIVSHIYGSYTSRPVLLPLRAIPPEHDRAAEALEAVLERKHLHDLSSVRLRCWIEDATKYGQGRFQSAWDTQREKVMETLRVPLAGMLGMQASPEWPMYGSIQRESERVKKEGPINLNIPPRDYLPDPRVPGWDPQAGEFVAVRTVKSKGYLKRRQRENVYFNVDQVSGTGDSREGTGRELVPSMSDLAGMEAWPADDPPTLLHQLEVRLVPADWKADDGSTLGSSQSEQIWLFTIANKATIIQAEPMPNRHGRFRVAVMDAAIDVHGLFSPSYPEIVRGVQEYADYAFNSRMANIRMGLLMAFLYDPELVEEDDVYSTQAGLRLRIKPDSKKPYRSLSEAIHQMPVSDFTQGLLTDIAASGGMIEQTLGAVAALQGKETPGSRSATEMAGIIRSAQNRVGQVGALMWDQGVVPWAMMEISDAQQFMSEGGYVRLSGDARRRWAAETGGRVMVGPDEIQGEIEIAPVDVTMPVDPQAEGALWLKLAMGVAKDARLSARYDAEEMFEEGARKLGAANIDDFKRQNPVEAQVMPDEQVMDQVQRGNLVPQQAPEDPMAALMAAAGMPA